MRVLLLFPLMFLASCDYATNAERNDKAVRLAALENRGIGRFQVVAASQTSPSLFVDTSTGCVMTISGDKELSKFPIKGPDGKLDPACFDFYGGRPYDPSKEFLK